MRRLALKLPTVLQTGKNIAILFHEGGVSQFLNPDVPNPSLGLRSLSRSARIWVLVDSNQQVSNPALIFCNRGPFFVVEAKSPPRQCPKENTFSTFYMKTWTFPEVLQAYVTPPSRGLHCSHFLQSSILRAFM